MFELPAGDVSSAADNPALQRRRRALLEKLAQMKNNPEVAEFAQWLLAGRTTPRELMTSSAYSELLDSHVRKFAEWYGSLSDVEREQAAVDGQRHLDELERAAFQPAQEVVRARRARPVDDVEEPSYDETDWTAE